MKSVHTVTGNGKQCNIYDAENAHEAIEILVKAQCSQLAVKIKKDVTYKLIESKEEDKEENPANCETPWTFRYVTNTYEINAGGRIAKFTATSFDRIK